MKRPKFTEGQVACILRQAEEGTAIGEVCRKAGISEATFYVWRKKYAGLMPSEMKRLIERVVLNPAPHGHRGFEIELVGEIAAMVALGAEGKNRSTQAARHDLFQSSIKAVAGAHNRRSHYSIVPIRAARRVADIALSQRQRGFESLRGRQAISRTCPRVADKLIARVALDACFIVVSAAD
jgi:AcrR family transcriptional regulator